MVGTSDVVEAMSRALPSHVRMAEIVAALMWGPKKDAELMQIVGVDHSGLNRCTLALQESGVIYRKSADKVPGQPGRPQKPWALQTKPFAMKDEA